MEFISAGPVTCLWAGSALFACWLVALWLGATALRAAGAPMNSLSDAERLLFSWGIGITGIALGVLGLGLAGLLTPLYAVGLLFFLAMLSQAFGGPRDAHRSFFYTLSKPRPVYLLLVAVPLLLSWAQAMLPPTGTDALAYHLFHPKEFVLHHRVFAMPFEMNRESLWPYQTEMLFTLGLLLQGTALAQLFHWSFYPMTAAAVYLLAKRFYGPRTGAFAGIAFLFIPAAFAQSGQAYVDLSLAFFVFLSAYLFLLWDGGRKKRFLLLCGLFCGAALGTKYLGLGWFFILAGLIALRSGFNARALLVFVAATCFTGGVWYLRSWWVTGNPVYPFFSGIFPGKDLWGLPLQVLDAAGKGEGKYFDIAWHGMGRGPVSFIFLIWNMTLRPAEFGGELLGPLFLMFLPFLVLRARRPSRPSLYLLIFAVAYTFFIFSQSQYTRFFLSCATFWCIGIAVALEAAMERPVFLRRVTLGAFLLVILLHTGIFCYRLRDAWPVLLGKESAGAYLSRHERSFRAHAYLKEHLKKGEKLFVSSEVTYFYNDAGSVAWDNMFLRNLLKKEGLGILDYLKRERFEYIWLFRVEPPFSPADERDFQLIHSYVTEHKNYQLVDAYDFPEKQTIYHNAIYKSKS